ncbi:hypothetical protein T265_06800 [Opisthorchis viverrini]|uniref:Uncharacterized protein n=1 Tax=Opisthorchis viverrini TaxID=6198 RepID=A0A074ZF67_OPIVI|nr:hypothetical protein T265_06800 [Opisthorchis viverrini]KER25828.1 hypothetical protein T265_06800 [Opisthorchis viverrini]
MTPDDVTRQEVMEKTSAAAELNRDCPLNVQHTTSFYGDFKVKTAYKLGHNRLCRISNDERSLARTIPLGVDKISKGLKWSPNAFQKKRELRPLVHPRHLYTADRLGSSMLLLIDNEAQSTASLTVFPERAKWQAVTRFHSSQSNSNIGRIALKVFEEFETQKVQQHGPADNTLKLEVKKHMSSSIPPVS